jgi:hypothetical protein
MSNIITIYNQKELGFIAMNFAIIIKRDISAFLMIGLKNSSLIGEK